MRIFFGSKVVLVADSTTAGLFGYLSYYRFDTGIHVCAARKQGSILLKSVL